MVRAYFKQLMLFGFAFSCFHTLLKGISKNSELAQMQGAEKW